MGANIINTILESISPYIESISNSRAGLKILSNLCTDRMVISKFLIPVSKMGHKGLSGEKVCKLILEAFEFAKLDPYRAATHNKGIMNGIDAVAIALG